MSLDIIIKQDTREQLPWAFDEEDKKPNRFTRVAGHIVECLTSCDYSVVGYEDTILIERKSGLSELFGNYSPKEHKERFENEWNRVIHVPHKYLIIESNLSKDIMSLSVPQFKSGLPASKVVSWIYDIAQEFNFVPIFAGDCGKKIARQLFETTIKKYVKK